MRAAEAGVARRSTEGTSGFWTIRNRQCVGLNGRQPNRSAIRRSIYLVSLIRRSLVNRRREYRARPRFVVKIRY
jgi:hypothetical protein